MMNKSSVALILLSLAAMAALSGAARDFPQVAAAGGVAQPQDFYYDNPFIPPWLKQISHPWIPYVPGVGFPPSPPSPPASSGGSSGCGPFIPAELCPLLGGSLPHAPPAAGGSSCGPFIPPAFCTFLGPFLPHAPPPAP